MSEERLQCGKSEKPHNHAYFFYSRKGEGNKYAMIPISGYNDGNSSKIILVPQLVAPWFDHPQHLGGSSGPVIIIMHIYNQVYDMFLFLFKMVQNELDKLPIWNSNSQFSCIIYEVRLQNMKIMKFCDSFPTGVQPSKWSLHLATKRKTIIGNSETWDLRAK